MIHPLNRCIVKSLNRLDGSTLQRFNNLTMQRLLIFCTLIFPFCIRAQSPPEMSLARSVSGQFVISGSSQPSPLASLPLVATNADFVRLEPALLSMSAERVKQSLRHQLGVSMDAPWHGTVFLALHPAQSLDEEVIIISQPSAKGCDYQVQLPDVLTQTRFLRALTGVVLLELAGRDANSAARSAEIPPWLTDGFSQQLLAENIANVILSSPRETVNGLSLMRTDSTRHNLDLLAGARRVLRNNPALTFEQLSWPDDEQLSGADGGVYRASAQLFVRSLLGLKNGAANLRAMLEDLPRSQNWQTAFHLAFLENFRRPLDVEKWWALQVVDFAAHQSGPAWTFADSRDRLDVILSVPAEFRAASNSLPVHTEVSLQAVIRNFDSDRQKTILQTKLRDLELAQFHVASQFAVVTDGYRRAISDYLGLQRKLQPQFPINKHPIVLQKPSADETIKKLDALDAQRRNVEAIGPAKSIQPGLAPKNIDLNAP
jgi:hypothetical protein